MKSGRLCILSLAVLGGFVLHAVAAEPADRLTAMDIFNFEFATDPQISPDGATIVYVRRFCDVMTDRRYSNLWTIDFDGSNHRPLTSGHQVDRTPRWSPDGHRLIYISDQDGSPQIYLRWMDTGQTAKLTNLQYPPSGLGWSPDGEMISFCSFVPSEPPVLAELPKPPPKAEWADPPKVIDRLVYRHDKAGYLEPGYTHLFVMPAERGTPRQVTRGDFHHGGFPYAGGTASWTPDSKSLIISANRHEGFEYDPLNTEVYEVSMADGAVKALTDRQGRDDSAVISPDGNYIAYTGFDDRYQGYQVTRLYVMKRDGTGSRLLSGDLDRDIGAYGHGLLRWAPDSSGVYFKYDDQGNTKLGFYSLDGTLTTLAENLGGSGSAYGGASYSVARNGRFAFAYSRPDVPGDIAVGTPAGDAPRVITTVNRDLLSHKTVGSVEEIWYDSSKDGRRIHGWIIKPPAFDPAKKYPLILEIHGGPFANYGDRFDVEKQLFAAHDYVVLYTNPRGSTSYGEDFGNLIHHSYPGDDHYDLISGVDAVLSRGYVDPENVFVTGGSGGGILTCWLIGKTDRFRAAAAIYPVINWFSIVLTSDMSAYFCKYWFPGMPWDYVAHYMGRSPITTVGHVKTPTMIMTGEEDYRTPISEAEQYYKALKLLKVDSVLVRVPGEPHGIYQRPSHHVAKVLNILAWFDQHRKNNGSAE